MAHDSTCLPCLLTHAELEMLMLSMNSRHHKCETNLSLWEHAVAYILYPRVSSLLS